MDDRRPWAPPPRGRPTVPRWAETAAAAARWPLWAGYGVSALVYVARIRKALRAAGAPGYVPAFFGASGWASEIFFLLGTVHWLGVGIHRNASPARTAASMALAGLHLILFAVRVYLGPLIWAVGATGRS